MKRRWRDRELAEIWYVPVVAVILAVVGIAACGEETGVTKSSVTVQTLEDGTRCAVARKGDGGIAIDCDWRTE